jgi:hypothetical protein
MYAVRRKTRSQQDPVGSLYCISARPLMGSPSNESLSTMFMRLSLPVVETAPASVSSKSHRHRIADTQPQHSGTSGISRSNKKSTGFTDSRHGQSVDVDMNHRATQYVGHKCEMTLFDPSALPQSLLEGIRPLVNRTNAKSSYEYEADLSLYVTSWRLSQSKDFQRYLNAPADAKPPRNGVVQRRAMSVLYDLCGDPPKSFKDEGIDLRSFRNVCRYLFELHQERPKLVRCEWSDEYKLIISRL